MATSKLGIMNLMGQAAHQKAQQPKADPDAEVAPKKKGFPPKKAAGPPEQAVPPAKPNFGKK